MRRNIFLALGLLALVSASIPASLRRGVNPISPATQRRARGAATRSEAVGEIDAEGLKRLLRRGPKSARPLLITFWATWCDPCREEFPDLVQVDRDYRARGLEFVTVSLDDPGEIKTGVPQFLRTMRATMPAYLLNVTDPEPAIKEVDATWGGGLPATFLFDAHGQVVFKHMGRIRPRELRSAIETVIGDK